MTGYLVVLVTLVTYVLHAKDGLIEAAGVSVFQHSVSSHDNVGERMTTSQNSRVIYVYKWALGSRGWVENEPMTIKFSENSAVVVVVRHKQHGRDSSTIHIASRRSRQDRLLTSCLFLKAV